VECKLKEMMNFITNLLISGNFYQYRVMSFVLNKSVVTDLQAIDKEERSAPVSGIRS